MEPSPAPGGTEASSSPVATEATPTPHRVCMVCDFFYPSMGGVENHVHQLAQCLLRLGHKVIVLTHQYGARTGVRWLATGLKVYYVPFAAVYDRVLPPTGLLLLPLFRDILIRERITLVHSHAVCTMALECVTLAATMGYRVVYTEHSNFGFSDSADIHINKLCRFVLSQADTVVTVSHTSKENVSLRCHLDPTNVFVIPNALDATQFRPDPDNISPKGCINVVVLTRLVWRKGTHLLVQLIPEVCRRFPYAHFIIGGDGPNRTEIEEMVERHQLQERVELLGAVQHCDVPSVLTRGHIFLNTSLTEAFCIALLEAVSCGLQVVSTRVGGVPEILPPHMLLLTEPEPTALLAALSEVITFARKRPLPNYHREVSQMYSWMQVARRTVKVYDQVALRVRPTLADRFHGLSELGSLSGMLAILIVALQHLFFKLLCFLRPESNIDLCPDFLSEEWASRRIKVEPLPISERYMSSLSQRRHFVMNGS